MEVTIQYVDGCPHLDETYRLVAETIESTGSHGVLRTFLVGSMEEAEQLHFPGSPTVLIDGVDPFAHSSAQIGLSCRLYGSGGSRSGIPPRDELEEALASSHRQTKGDKSRT